MIVYEPTTFPGQQVLSVRRRRRSWSWKKKAAMVLVAGFGLLVALFVTAYALTAIPKPSQDATSQATIIQFAGGQELGRVGAQNRILVSLDAVSEPAQKAVLAAEDRGFYSEPGISLKGIARALVTNVRGGGSIQQGGSTITQQYAKNAFLTQKRSYSRKLKELFIALKLSQTRSKRQILQDYLNTIYFGRGASGIQVAAKVYFGTTADKLTVAQGAVLAGSISSPAGNDPARHPLRAQQRFAYVLDGMVKQGWLSAAERATVTYPKVLRLGSSAGATNDRSGWKGYIIDQVEAELAQHGFSEQRLTSAGLVVKTTIRLGAQLAAVDAVTNAVPPISNPADHHSPQAALVSVAAGTGEVWAYYGGSIGQGGIDFASGDDPRQPGSSFKPYVLATALAEGKSLRSRYDGSSPQTICGQRIMNDQGDPPLGPTDLAQGLALSVNTVYFRLACEVGPPKIAALAHAAGVSAPLKTEGSTAAGIGLGIYNVSVLDQATGFATFAAHGLHSESHFVKSVSDSAGTVYRAKAQSSSAFSTQIAADATFAMQQVVTAGTGTRAALANRPVAGKTGTTSDNVDAWFCGFTPQLATAVWIGRQDHQPLKGALGVDGGVYGGTIPAAVFKQYMDSALKDQPTQDFPSRANVGTTDSGTNSPPYVPPTGRLRTPVPAQSPSPLPSNSAPSQPSPTAPPPSRIPAQPSNSPSPPPGGPPPSQAPAPSPSPT